MFLLKLVEHNYFEASKGKTVLDTHFAHVSHKLVRWVRVGMLDAKNLSLKEQSPQEKSVHSKIFPCLEITQFPLMEEWLLSPWLVLGSRQRKPKNRCR